MTNTNKKKIWPFIVLVILVILFFTVKGNYREINEIINPPKTPTPPASADVSLYKFNALSNNETINIEIWLLNLGEKTATNITVFIRSRSKNSTILYEGEILLSSLILRAGEICTGAYTLYYADESPSETHIYHTIEVSWEDGRRVYSKETR